MATQSIFPNSNPAHSVTEPEPLVKFRAGRMNLEGTTVTADPRKGNVQIIQDPESLVHFRWIDRTTQAVEEDLIVFPEEAEWVRVPQCTTGRAFLLKFNTSSRKFFFWMQEPSEDKDEYFLERVNEALNNQQ